MNCAKHMHQALRVIAEIKQEEHIELERCTMFKDCKT